MSTNLRATGRPSRHLAIDFMIILSASVTTILFPTDQPSLLILLCIPIPMIIFSLQRSSRLKGKGGGWIQQNLTDHQSNPGLDHDRILLDVVVTANTTHHWTNDRTANADPTMFDSRLRCYIRFAICAVRTRRVYERYFIKEKQEKISGYFTRGNCERKCCGIPGGQIPGYFVKVSMPNSAGPASCTFVGSLTKRSQSTLALPGCAHYRAL